MDLGNQFIDVEQDLEETQATEALLEEMVTQQVREDLEQTERQAKMLTERIKTWNKYKERGTLEQFITASSDLAWETFKAVYPVCTDRTFSAKIGVSKDVIGRMWVRYYLDFLSRSVDMVNLLVTMNFFKENLSMDSLAANWGMTRTTCHKIIEHTQIALFEILDEVSWNRNEAWHPEEVVSPQGHPFYGVTFSIDGIECGIAKPFNDDEENVWYSDKAGQHTVKYELCTHVSSGRIMWISGGIPGSVHDYALLQSSGILEKIPDGQKGFADKGYSGAPPDKLLVMLKKNRGQPYLDFDEYVFNKAVSALRIEIERVNGRLKNFGVLWRWRGRNRYSHSVIFRVLCNIVNIQMEIQPMRKNLHPILLNADIIVPERAM